MTYRIQTKKSNVPELIPHPSELLPGELALNYSDMILYALDSDGSVQQVSSSGGGSDGDLIAMDYTFWVKVVQEGEPLRRFEGLDDNGKSYDVNINGFDVALNGVSLVPVTDYSIDDTALILVEPATVGDVVIIRSLKAADGVAPGVLTTNDIALLGEDTTLPVPTEYREWLTRNNLKTQQDANWHLLHKIEDLDIPDGVDLSDYATKQESTDGDDVTLADAKAYTDQEIAAIPPTDLSDYATKKESTDGDAKALEDSKKYTDQKVDAIVFPPGTIVKDTEPQNAPNGTNWFDTVRLELFVRASDSWVPSSPLGARVSQGEIVQAQILDRIDGLTTTEYVDGADQAVQRFATTADEAVLNAAKKYTDDSLGTIPDGSSDVDKAYVDAQDATKIGNTGERGTSDLKRGSYVLRRLTTQETIPISLFKTTL